jgi:hypothetical protein
MLASLRQLNIDAITQWVYQGLTVDGLPRSLWYTPQHAQACAFGLVALVVSGSARRDVRWPAVLLAGAALAAAVVTSPFLGGAFSLIYGLTVFVTSAAEWRVLPRRAVLHALAAVPVVLALLWCQANSVVDGAGTAWHVGFRGPIAKAPFLAPALTLGPLLLAAAAGMWVARRRLAFAMAPAIAGVVVGFGLFYFVTLPGGDVQWIGWRAGQILLLTLPPLAACWIAACLDAPRKWRVPGLAAATILFAIGLPTTVIDTYNAQDISNREISAGGFRWTVVILGPEARALAWIRTSTPTTAVVQMEPTIRGREAWTLIPSFAHRRMAAGLPISLLKKPVYAERSDQIRALFTTLDPHEAWNIATRYAIEYLYVDRTDRRAYFGRLEKFDQNPQYFTPVFKDGNAAVYLVHRSSATARLQLPGSLRDD